MAQGAYCVVLCSRQWQCSRDPPWLPRDRLICFLSSLSRQYIRTPDVCFCSHLAFVVPSLFWPLFVVKTFSVHHMLSASRTTKKHEARYRIFVDHSQLLLSANIVANLPYNPSFSQPSQALLAAAYPTTFVHLYEQATTLTPTQYPVQTQHIFLTHKYPAKYRLTSCECGPLFFLT